MTVSDLIRILTKFEDYGFGGTEIKIRNENNPFNTFPIIKTEFVETSTLDETRNSLYIDCSD